MILHLTGASETARILIADKLLDNHQDWRYLALEDMFEDEIPDEPHEIFQMNTVLACQCVVEQAGTNVNLVVTTPFAEFIDTVKDELEGDHITVLLGEDGDVAAFDHVIDAGATSATETIGILEEIIANRA